MSMHKRPRRGWLLGLVSAFLLSFGPACSDGGGGNDDNGDNNGSTASTVGRPTGTVQGFVTDTDTGGPLAGVTVTVYGGAALPAATTDDAGYFSVSNVPSSGGILVRYELTGYRPRTRTVALSDAIGNSELPQGNSLTDASISLQRDETTRIAGTVYLPTQPAAGVEVLLRQNSGSLILQRTTTDDGGAFSFDAVPLSTQTLFVDVPGVDVDGDGFNDFAYRSVNIGNRFSVTDWSNIVVTLAAPAPRVVFTNLQAPGGGVGSVASTAPLLVHFGAEVQRESFRAWLMNPALEVVETLTGEDFVNDVVLSKQPANPMLPDADAGTRWRLRIDGLLFVDGSIYADPLNPDDFEDLVFDVPGTPNSIAAPIPQLFFGDVRCGETRENPTNAIADHSVVRLLTGAGAPCEDGGEVTWDSTNGIQLSWAHIPGAVKYEVWARNAIPGFGNDLTWRRVNHAALEGWEPNVQQTVVARSVNVFDGFGIRGGEPFGWGNTVLVAVVAEDAAGFRSTLPPAGGSVSLSDGWAPALSNLTYRGGDTERGNLGIEAELDLRFTETLDTTQLPVLEVTSGAIVGASIQLGTPRWDDSAVPPNGADRLVLEGFSFDAKGGCTELISDVAEGASILRLRSVTGIPANPAARAIVITQNAASFETLVGLEPEAATGRVGLGAATVGDHNEGELFCILDGQATQVATVLGEIVAGHADMIAVSDATLFHLGQQVILFADSTTLGLVTITRIDTVQNRIGLNAPVAFPIAAGQGRVLPWFPNGYAPRTADRAGIGLSRDAIAGPSQFLHLSATPGASILVGDAVLLDQDGDLDTTGDQEVARIEAILEDGTGDPQIAVTLTSPLISGQSTIHGLGDVLTVTGPLTDTSGNGPLDPRRNSISLGHGGGGNPLIHRAPPAGN